MKTYNERPVPPKRVVAEQMKFNGTLQSSTAEIPWEVTFTATDYLVWIVQGETPANISDFPEKPEVLSQEEFDSKYVTETELFKHPYKHLMNMNPPVEAPPSIVIGTVRYRPCTIPVRIKL